MKKLAPWDTVKPCCNSVNPDCCIHPQAFLAFPSSLYSPSLRDEPKVKDPKNYHDASEARAGHIRNVIERLKTVKQ
jgi:hypothetical protein